MRVLDSTPERGLRRDLHHRQQHVENRHAVSPPGDAVTTGPLSRVMICENMWVDIIPDRQSIRGEAPTHPQPHTL
jgi:hypothetical protein